MPSFSGAPSSRDSNHRCDGSVITPTQVVVGADDTHAMEPALAQSAQEVAPEGLVLGAAHGTAAEARNLRLGDAGGSAERRHQFVDPAVGPEFRISQRVLRPRDHDRRDPVSRE